LALHLAFTGSQTGDVNSSKGLGPREKGDNMWLKTCPKCAKGDLLLEKDMYGEFIHCLQCGYNQDLIALESNKAVFRKAETKLVALANR